MALSSQTEESETKSGCQLVVLKSKAMLVPMTQCGRDSKTGLSGGTGDGQVPSNRRFWPQGSCTVLLSFP